MFWNKNKTEIQLQFDLFVFSSIFFCFFFLQKSWLLSLQRKQKCNHRSTLRDAQGLWGRLLDAKPVPALGGAKQLVLPAFFKPNSVFAMLAFIAIIGA